MDDFLLEYFLEEALQEITKKHVVVGILGDEVCINVEGELYHFRK